MKKAKLAETVKLAQSGDKDAVEALYRQYRDRIWFFVCKNVGSKQAAEDIVSDTFLTAIEKLGELRCADAFGSWLYSIAYNKCLRYLNSESGIARFESEEMLDSTIENALLNEPVKLPSDYIENEQTRQQLRDAIDSLKPEMRSAVIMYYFEEMSVSDVAKALGLKENAAKQRLFRARKKLSEKLKKLCGSETQLCVLPLGAVLNASLEESHLSAGTASGAAVKAGFAAKIAAVGITAALAVGAPIALINNRSYGDYQPEKMIVSQDDELKDEANEFLNKLTDKYFDYTAGKLPLIRTDGSSTSVLIDAETHSREGTASDIGVPKMFLDNKDKWKATLCKDTYESGVYCVQMRYFEPATTIWLYCPGAEVTDTELTYRLYIPKYPYKHTDGCKYIRIEMTLPRTDTDLESKMLTNQVSGRSFRSERMHSLGPEKGASVNESDVGVNNIEVRKADNSSLDIFITPDLNILDDVKSMDLSIASYIGDTSKSTTCLLKTDSSESHFITGIDKEYTLSREMLSKKNGFIKPDSCWHIRVESIPKQCGRITICLRFAGMNDSGGSSSDTRFTLNVDISKMRDEKGQG